MTKAKKKAERSRGNYVRSNVDYETDKAILTDYERGTFWAGLLIGMSYALMGLGSVVFGW